MNLGTPMQAQERPSQINGRQTIESVMVMSATKAENSLLGKRRRPNEDDEISSFLHPKRQRMCVTTPNSPDELKVSSPFEPSSFSTNIRGFTGSVIDEEHTSLSRPLCVNCDPMPLELGPVFFHNELPSAP